MTRTTFRLMCIPKGGGAPFLADEFDTYEDARYAMRECVEAYGPGGDRFRIDHVVTMVVGL